MATTQTVVQHESGDSRDRTRSWGDVAVSFAGRMSGADFPRGDLAGLRRMQSDRPDVTAFWRLMAQEDLLGSPELESKWSLIIHGIALMTPTGSGNADGHSAHDGSMPVGRALFLGGDPQRNTALYSETRLNRLLTARGPMLRTLLSRMFRMTAASGVSFNWREMSRFVLNEGRDEEAAEQSRRRIARDYYRAQRRSAQMDTDRD